MGFKKCQLMYFDVLFVYYNWLISSCQYVCSQCVWAVYVLSGRKIPINMPLCASTGHVRGPVLATNGMFTWIPIALLFSWVGQCFDILYFTYLRIFEISDIWVTKILKPDLVIEHQIDVWNIIFSPICII